MGRLQLTESSAKMVCGFGMVAAVGAIVENAYNLKFGLRGATKQVLNY
jgi:hypothetical protein